MSSACGALSRRPVADRFTGSAVSANAAAPYGCAREAKCGSTPRCKPSWMPFPKGGSAVAMAGHNSASVHCGVAVDPNAGSNPGMGDGLAGHGFSPSTGTPASSRRWPIAPRLRFARQRDSIERLQAQVFVMSTVAVPRGERAVCTRNLYIAHRGRIARWVYFSMEFDPRKWARLQPPPIVNILLF